VNWPGWLRTCNASEIGVEYLAPTDNDRNIQTINLRFSHLLKRIEKNGLQILAGGLFTYADGNISQLEGELESGTLRKINYNNTAIGLGPGVTLRSSLALTPDLTFSIHGSAYFVLYNKRFPAGGDYYNIMWRVGPRFGYSFGGNRAVSLSFLKVHVSNGQGVNSGNPSYDAQGVSFSVRKRL